MSKPIYLHIFDRELRTVTHAQFTDNNVFRIVLTAVLMSDSCYAANSNLAESESDFPHSVQLVYGLEKAGIVKILTTTESSEEFIEARQRLYHKVPERYPMYFDLKKMFFPAQPLVLRNSTTEELQTNLLGSLRKSVPTPLAPKVADVTNAIRNRDGNAITVGVLSQMTPFNPIQAHYMGILISENYNKRYLDAMNGCLIKGLPYISHFDQFSSEKFYYDLYAPVFNQAYLRFVMQENDTDKRILMVTSITHQDRRLRRDRAQQWRL